MTDQRGIGVGTQMDGNGGMAMSATDRVVQSLFLAIHIHADTDAVIYGSQVDLFATTDLLRILMRGVINAIVKQELRHGPVS